MIESLVFQPEGLPASIVITGKLNNDAWRACKVIGRVRCHSIAENARQTLRLPRMVTECQSTRRGGRRVGNLTISRPIPTAGPLSRDLNTYHWIKKMIVTCLPQMDVLL
ncbi:hypothetical protein EVAR_21178_1 [Eumeta japonica]|uniref:Uncharacterized protein n=1 Tax=Eumeta variegata TaxID=151549 RepID=A0A4C1UNL5_EUMVA|nr:hypothetical protein EVAR_21178_1 [Eumeta japonica]